LCKEAKRAISKAKFKQYDELYDKLETKKGKKEIYRLAKVVEKRFKDFQKAWCIKSVDKRVLTNDEDMKKRWK